MSLNVNASSPIAVTKVYFIERFPLAIQDSDYFIVRYIAVALTFDEPCLDLPGLLNAESYT